MRSKFFEGFEKRAFIVPALKAIGKTVIKASGGPLNTALNVLGVASDAKSISDKLKQTYVR